MGYGPQARALSEQFLDFGRREDIGLEGLMGSGKKCDLGHEALGITTAAIEAEVAHNSHLGSSRSRVKSFFFLTPPVEGFEIEIVVWVLRISQELVEG
jgi:hypothetical protein